MPDAGLQYFSSSSGQHTSGCVAALPLIAASKDGQNAQIDKVKQSLLLPSD
jgi:hypothetical protein